MKTITPADIETVNDIMGMQDVLKDSQKVKQDEIKDAIKTLADRMKTTPPRIVNIIKLVRKEMSEPGTIEFEQELLDNAEAVAR